jgi:hypothetical protein
MCSYDDWPAVSVPPTQRRHRTHAAGLHITASWAE